MVEETSDAVVVMEADVVAAAEVDEVAGLEVVIRWLVVLGVGGGVAFLVVVVGVGAGAPAPYSHSPGNTPNIEGSKYAYRPVVKSRLLKPQLLH